MNRSRRRALLLVSCLTALAVAFGGSAVAGAAPRTSTTAGDRYAVARPVCAKPADPDLVRCLAMRRVTVRKGTHGAVRWVRRAGVSYGPAGGYTPADLAAAYRLTTTTKRSNQTVAVINWHDNPDALKDLNAFDKHYGFHAETKSSFRKVNQSGKTSPLPVKDREAATEISLDLQAVRSVCRTCRILLVEAKQGTLADLGAAVNTAVRLGATEISNSYGIPEPRHVAASVVAAYNHPGIPITVSTGDDGWYGWDWLNEGDVSDNAASFPSTASSVVAVGGTTLRLGAGAARTSEYVWNGNGADDTVGQARGRRGASGGGCSRLFAAPAWQKATPGYTAAGCRGKRLATDVAAIADPMYGFDVYDRYGIGGWGTIGGTSLAAPIVAAMYALAGGARGTTFPASSLYTNRTYRSTSLYDITLGGTGYCAGDATAACQQSASNFSGGTATNPNGIGGGLVECSYPRTGKKSALPRLSSECNATPGFDGASGVGAPKSASAMISTTAALSLSHPKSVRAKHRGALGVTAHQRVAGTSVVSVRWTFGDGSKAVSGRTYHLHHTWRKRGSYTVTVRTYDSRHQYATTHATVRVT